MSFIREGGRQVQKRFAEVLRLFWEGLLFEYLRSVGCPLRDAEHDPRHFVTRYWRRSMLDPSLRPGFVPFYLTREAKKRSTIVQEDRDIRDIRAGLITREQVVKDAETKVRRQHDYRFVLQYFSASRDLHRTLVGNVTYLANEVEQLRANMDHSTESISIMEKQFVELETKYDRVVGGFVHRGAFQLTVEGTLYSMINQGNATVKAAEHIAKQLLQGMEVGPAYWDGNRGTHGVSNNAPLQFPGGQRASTGVGFSEDTQQGGQGDIKNRDGVPVVVSDGGNKETWAAPRSQQGISIVRGPSSTKNPSPKAMATAAMEIALPACSSGENNDYKGAGSGHNGLASCLVQVRETHRRACTRYARLVTELEDRNASLAAAAAEAAKEKSEALVQAGEWEARLIVLEERLAEVESRSKDELALAEEQARDAHRRTLETTALMKDRLEKATPTLVDMVAAFLPRDTEELGVGLFQNLGIDPDLYVHLLATKSMFKADLESRAFEAVSGEQTREAVEENVDDHEEANTASGKKERGRPRSRGKGSGKGENSGKSGGKSRSKSTTSSKATKSGDKREKGKGTGKAADKSDKSKGGKTGDKSSRQKSTSPSRGGGVEKDGVSSDQKKGGGKNKDGDERSSSPAKKVVSKKKKK